MPPVVQEREVSTTPRVERFFSRFRWVILGTLLLVIAVLTGFFTYQQREAALLDKGTYEVEQLEERFARLQTSDREQVGDEEVLSLEEDLKGVVDTYGKAYPSQRAMYLLGHLAFWQEDWDDASIWFDRLAKEFPRSYLAAVALLDAAAARENLGDTSGATTRYEKVIEAGFSVLKPRALFSLGRLKESSGDREGARQIYTQLLEDYPSSQWSHLARDRMIFLQLQE
ncbi:hypothetical protein Spith_1123 [Spirochaeta thermophila DSM 6578]|uniref:Uncharacterized protein n=1 Tax=Winmispira thermophila (strain ATCC 700085 / DSM 6578 / Z-1203) TaxID=869211 RepID=G0GE42_WINT7|nr:tetratricopeptide repeat protein [Spirochaeta thermophila]AEJ61395.1 hypothetical protein Spith_1123 [Spirochaeta thermophila DSM 6578]